MKIKKIKIHRLLKLNLLKSKVYEQPIKKMKFDNFIDVNLNQIIVSIKKILQIIFQYHKTGKRILFLGLPCKLELKVNQSTKHVAVTKNLSIPGMISNCKSFKNYGNSNQTWLKNSSKFLLPKLSKRLDLIVLFDQDKNEKILSEAKIAKIPVIFFGTNFESQSRALYSVKGNFKRILTSCDKNVFFIGLSFLLKNRKIHDL